MRELFTKTIVIMLALAVTACSATPVRRSFKETWHDSLTAGKIRYKMMRDSDVKKSRMHVEVFRGQVTLTGRSVGDAEKARAETLAKSVKRVTGVENYVHVVGGQDAAVAKAPVTGVPIVAVSPKAALTPPPVIQEKTIKADKARPAGTDEIPAMLPTIREGTGTGKGAVLAPIAGRPAAPAKGDAKLVTVQKPAPQKLAPVAKVAPTAVPSPVVSSPVTPAPASRVVGQSKTGLPWDGEVYEDDASRVSSVAAPPKTAVTPKAATAARNPAATPPPAPAPAANLAPSPGDDLAKEAAQELEKLRQKK